MVEVLVVTHGPLGKALVETAQLILGNTLRVTAFGLYHGDSIEALEEMIQTHIIKMRSDGALVLTDLFGGSPCNRTALVMKALENTSRVECLTGVNLPLLIEALSMQDVLPLEELVRHCRQKGSEGIVNLREELSF